MPIKPLALTLGEPAGIGPDIALAAWTRRDELSLPPFYIAADRAFLDARAQRLGLKVATASVTPGEAAGAFATALPVADIGVAATAAPGAPDDASPVAAIASI